MPIAPSPKSRHDLTIEDIRQYPIWEYTLHAEERYPDESYVEPVLGKYSVNPIPLPMPPGSLRHRMSPVLVCQAVSGWVRPCL